MHEVLAVRSRRVVTPDGIRPASIQVRDGRIERVGGYAEAPPGAIDYGDLVLMAGIVDSHVHVNEPGRTEWEGFATATRAAAAGGVTTIVDMPLNSIPPTTTVDALLMKAEALQGKSWVDVGLWGGATPDNSDDLFPLLDAGALGFKCFLIDSGVPEFPHLSASDLSNTAEILRDTSAPLLVHAELPEHVNQPSDGSYRAYLESRARAAEDHAVDLLFRLTKRTHAWIHVVHLSSSGALGTLRRAHESGLPLTAETTPHYLRFAAGEIPDEATEYKCAPPIREGENREQLWVGLAEGLIDMVVTDHSPAPPELKRGDFATAWGGIASVQFGLAATWTEARQRGFEVQDVARWMCEGPARLANLASRKGAIASGFDADFVIWDPEQSFRVASSKIEHRHKMTPYAGVELYGIVKATWLRGKKIYEDGEFLGMPSGVWVR